MKRAVVWRLTFWVTCILWGGAISFAQGPEKVLVGELNSRSGRIKFTGGTLFKSSSKSFPSYRLASLALQQKGVSAAATDELGQRLRESVAALERSSDRMSLQTEPQTTQGIYRPVSLVEVQKKVAYVYSFEVFTGREDVIAASYNSNECERLNEKCFICSDGKIRCETPAIKSRDESKPRRPR